MRPSSAITAAGVRVRVGGADATGKAANVAEHVIVDTEAAQKSGAGLGRQVRLYNDDNDVGLFTIVGIEHSHDVPRIWLGPEGRARIGAHLDRTITLIAVAARPMLSPEEAMTQGELIEESQARGSDRLVVIAPHGGMIEEHTCEQAVHVAKRMDASWWVCRGWKPSGGAFKRWHIRSIDIDVDSFAGLKAIAERRYRMGLAFHGMEKEEVLIGGGAPRALKQELAREIIRATGGKVPLRIAESKDPSGGYDPKNIINRLTQAGGLQLEQGPKARKVFGKTIADAAAVTLQRWLARG